MSFFSANGWVNRPAVACLAILLLVSGALIPAQAAELRQLATRVRSPELASAGDWLNSSAPIDLASLRGKFVVLDFWTYCCINCIHLLPHLKQLEETYSQEVVVLGIHSAKFPNERDTARIRDAILRHDVGHPVLNDFDMSVWQRFNASMWPTVIVIDPEGYIIARHEGEIQFQAMKPFFERAIAHYRRRGVLDETPVTFELEQLSEEPQPLRFPGKVLADQATDRLYIADSSHHRIVVTTLDGQLVAVIGNGTPGRRDGTFAQATFRSPQGMALYGRDQLYVADTENHAIRRVDFSTGQVTTVAGTGEQLLRPLVRTRHAPTAQELSSPWDLLIHQQRMFVAMAGVHQIWVMHLPDGRIEPYAGNVIEDVVNGPRLPRAPMQQGFSSFAQPSGLATDGRWLFVADSEGSSIRAVPLDPRRQVATVVGTAHLPAARLFTFGDRDGPWNQALLQHPKGVAYHEDQIFVADTYNHKIKKISIPQRQIVTVAGDGMAGYGDRPARFREPMGLSIAGNQLYVADTNNHAIRIIDLDSPEHVDTLEIPDLTPPERETSVTIPEADEVNTWEAMAVQPQEGKLDLALKIEFPDRYYLLESMPPQLFVESTGEQSSLFQSPRQGPIELDVQVDGALQTQIPLARMPGSDHVRLTLVYYYCRQGAEGICRIGSVSWAGGLSIEPAAAAARLELTHRAVVAP